jgi:hypothetical protein
MPKFPFTSKKLIQTPHKRHQLKVAIASECPLLGVKRTFHHYDEVTQPP